ncbi:hypothetical protein [Nocardioides sp. P86]|uniref:hypothetical protein n=1 Tax=Nocardioides sp. P86 TaxID=2939569 RepID=UPI00203DB89B|nr:hypothetical protein [Nocardioides sp. P86]MCM3517249.1 hypothetical protein [Nocardioides sp. P86]
MSGPVLLDPVLLAPEEGDPQRRHDATFESWDTAFSALRDTINLGVRALNGVGAGLPELPGGSLEELVVLPLSGDYTAIRQNATACVTTGAAWAAWAGNLDRLAVHVALGWGGLAGAACAARIEGLALAGRAVGAVVERGAIVLEEVADVSERLGVEVEHLVVELGKAMARLVRRLLSRACGPAGWAALAAEVTMKGLDAIADLVDDVRLVVDLLQRLLELKETVPVWARHVGDRLALLASLPDLVP